ncbi:uncharacterized protein LOC128678235 [Plodia interpunctella]|uniref:uncharacterized protein LOC128678235 n=1 Tax=Plodia interpunctella TaxID=58824 RepID=UPI002367E8AE|nr:uncharacterized protein LOC128678235 [Plodia interpunctella]XP_053615631.1 uncharacterized protein LOC128678235 [Plodia interpunctella]XP_053615639.1 uncharacterized protein LOC128678235 [Plodia interpunctella]XP_053615648.1 uncharacterized protein LOC128678235 [Plodia interpunctella]XP_053615656.1 uncharacterized protein LOC128678235 [Plodia interpunctella]XP_053615665.1 uncharacterized protein LOC128678235 [Plodia interpunctella]
MRQALALLLVAVCAVASAQIAWTPIFLDGSSQVDLWTQSSTGCACPGGGGEDCACCVRDGACPCGDVAPTRCAQCGLEQYCANMCNITIDSRILKSKSGKTFGQIKSPSIEGPGSCSYFLQPDAGQRVEIQIYRLVSVGRFNGTSCVGGWLQLGGAGAVRSTVAAETRLCGANERYTPPVVLFADHGASTLEFRITEKTVRSQFLAFFSFTSLSNSQGVGFHPRGGSRIPHTDCDWLYQDVSCRTPGSCVLASPGYPGLYPPHRLCRYLFTTNSVNTRVKIIFTSILLPRNHCATDSLSMRAGNSPSAPLLGTLCSERTATLEYPGPNLLLEFTSGPLVPPYDYNGFIAKLEFIEGVDASGPPPTVLPASPPLAALTHHVQSVDRMAIESNAVSNEVSNNGRVGCGATVRGFGPGGARSGHFDTRATTWRSQCAIHLLGASTDVVQVSLFNYNLRLPSCRSHIEILEGLHEFGGRGDRLDRSERGDRALLRVCGPSMREARDQSGRFHIRQAVTSKGANLTIMVRRSASQNEEEFVDGAFAFHDEQHEGTASPDAMCASTHYGLAAPTHGGVSAPSHHHIFWNIEERLLCTHRFIPAANQSVTIEIQRLDRMWSAEPTGTVGAAGCRTACGDAGCECRANTPLHYHDHIALVAGDGTHLSCLCGDFQAPWLPVVVRSWTSVRLEYSVAHYTYASRGFDYAAAYSFNDDSMCGQRTYTTHSGEISSRNVTVTGSLNEFFYQQCTWVLDSNVERQLLIDITSEQDKSCSSWNITLHEWSGSGAHSDAGLAAAAGELLYTFCARHKNHTYTLPYRLNTVVIRLVALSRQQPFYTIRWRSQVVRANNRLGPPTPAPAASAAAAIPHTTLANIMLTYLVLILLTETLKTI